MSRSRRKVKCVRPGDGCWHCDAEARKQKHVELKNEIAAGVREGLEPLAELVADAEQAMKKISVKLKIAAKRTEQ